MSDRHTGVSNSSIKVTWCLPDGTRRNQTVPDMDSLMQLLRSPAGVTIGNAAYQISHSKMFLKTRRLTVIVQLT